MMPAIYGGRTGDSSVAASLGLAALKVAILTALILVGGRRVVPWLLTRIAATRSRELFTLTVLALALCISVASAQFFGVSMALGHFSPVSSSADPNSACARHPRRCRCVTRSPSCSSFR